MGRHKTCDREDVTRKAMELLGAQGFAATSTKALADHMEINVCSLFAEFDFYVANATRPHAEFGCFACNVASESASRDAASHDYVAAHFDSLERRFRDAPTNTKARGHLRADVSCEDHAKLLVSIVLGFSVLARANPGAEPMVDAARQDLQRIMV